MSNSPDYKERAAQMRSTAEAFCKAFVNNGASPYVTLDKYFTPSPKILEHGPKWATKRLPFLGTMFEGRQPKGTSHKPTGKTCDYYYDFLTSTLSFHPQKDTVPPKEEFMVDAERMTVTIKLQAEFASVTTGKS